MAAKTKSKPITAQNPPDDLASNDSDNKKGKKEKIKKEKKPKNKKKNGKIIPIIVLLAIVGSLVAILVFNVFAIRDKYLTPFLEKIPIVNNLLPSSDEVVLDEYSSLSREQLIAQIKELKLQENQNLEDIKNLNDKNKLLVDEATKLKELEAQQLQFKADKEEFDRLIAENDPNAYSKFYEQVSPENAATLYKEAVVTQQQSKEMKKYLTMIQGMDESSSAKTLEEMVGTDLDLVVQIIKNINSETAGSILAAMDPKNSATILKRAYPEQQ